MTHLVCPKVEAYGVQMSREKRAIKLRNAGLWTLDDILTASWTVCLCLIVNVVEESKGWISVQSVVTCLLVILVMSMDLTNTALCRHNILVRRDDAVLQFDDLRLDSLIFNDH